MVKSLKFVGMGGFIVAAVIVLTPATGFAAEMRGASQASVGRNEVINNDLYIAGSSVMSSGTINGGLNAAGGNVLVTGPVSQDISAAGGTLTVLGAVGGSVRAVGGNITITSSVQRDIVAAGGQIQITGGEVGRDVALASGTARVESPVKGSLQFRGGEIYINAPVTGDVTIDAQKVTLGPSAIISGNFSYKADQQAVMESGAQVNGAVNFTPHVVKKNDFKQGVAAFLAFWFIAKFLMLLAGALVFGLLFKRFSSNLVEGAFAEPVTAIGRGLIAAIALPILSVILLVTIVGIPFGVLGIIGFIALLIVSWLIAPLFIGSLLYKWLTRGNHEVSWKTILIGVLVLTILDLIPFVGWVIVLGFWLLTFGAFVKFKLGEVRKWRS